MHEGRVSGVMIILAFSLNTVNGDYVLGNVQCYTCRDAESNEDCTKVTAPCPSYTHACETHFEKERKDRPLKINKRCVNIDFCYLEGSQYCNEEMCSYCCSSHLCNYNLSLPEKPSTSPPVSPGCPSRKGPKGDFGRAGPVGPPGDPGIVGLAGSPGSSVPTLPGPPGAPGDRGPPGEPGVKGNRGPPGLPGVNGLNGLMGDAGLPGVNGLPGRRGEPGERGDKGLTGMTGRRGLKGEEAPCSCSGHRLHQNVVFSGTASGVTRADSEEYAPVLLNHMFINSGNAFNNETGVFIAPVKGVYMFSFTSSTTGNGAAPLVLFVNELFIAQSGRSDFKATGPFSLGANQVYLNLRESDEVVLKVKPSGEGLWSQIIKRFSTESDITFTGHLVTTL